MFTIADMLKLSVFQGAVVLAWRAGLRRKVLFVDCIEVPDVARWLAAHTFIFTTAFAFRDNPAGLTELVAACGEAKIAGLGVKLGRYIQDFPQEAYCIAERYNMPLISLPAKLPWMAITRTVMREVFRDEKEEQRELGAVGADVLFFFDRDPEGAFTQLQSMGGIPDDLCGFCNGIAGRNRKFILPIVLVLSVKKNLLAQLCRLCLMKRHGLFWPFCNRRIQTR